MAMLTALRLGEILRGFARLRVALVGDLFLDRYLEIDVGLDEPSIETGLTAYQVTRVRNSPGALGTVMNNLAALGARRLLPVTVIGDDGHGDDLLREMRKLPVDLGGVVRDGGRLTPTYTKPLRQEPGGPWRELNRLDVRTRSPLGEAVTTELVGRLRDAAERADGLIVLDQIVEAELGVVNGQVRDALRAMSRANPDKLILIDSRAHLGEFDFGSLKGNRSEFLHAGGASSNQASEAATALARRAGRAAFCTIGEEGILVARPDGAVERSPAPKVTGPIDIVGAGDSATAALCLSLLAGAGELEAAEIANLVASITIEQLGTTGTASPEQVMNRCAAGY